MFGDHVFAGLLGAGIKMAGSLIPLVVQWRQESRRQAVELEMMRDKGRLEAMLKFREQFMAPTGDPEHVRYTLWTRRVLALMVMSTFSAVTIVSLWWPSVTLVIIEPAGTRDGFSLLWGLVKFPVATKTVEITTGALAYQSSLIYTMVAVAYFCPGIGQK